MRVFDSLESARPDRPTCVALGLFDGLHLGHRAVVGRMLEQARARELVPALFTFSLEEGEPGSKAGAAQLVTSRYRLALLESWGVEMVFHPSFREFRGMEPAAFVEEVLLGRFRAGAVCCGENFRFGAGARAGAEDLRRLGEKAGLPVLVEPLVRLEGGQVSSTRIRALIGAGDIPEANRLLGRRFSIGFPVVEGRKLGRTIGSPTINQPFPPEFVTPRFGVYATLTEAGGRWLPSVTNVGVKPTVGSDRLLAETYIHGFRGDLYGREVRVEFLEFIRPERKFASVEQLKEQIALDSQQAAEIAGGLEL